MSLSIPCPECGARIEAPDEHIGRCGQCPRCKHVFTIGIGQKSAPMPLAFGTPTEGVGERLRELARSARPICPRGLGIFAGLAAIAVIVSSIAGLAYSRRSAPDINGQAANDGSRVLVGRLEKNHVTLVNGVFQIRTELKPNGPLDFHLKRFEIELRDDRTYVIEQDAAQFDSEIRVEDLKNNLLISDWGSRSRSARLEFRPHHTGVYLVYAMTREPAFGNFTLTIRENDRPKPFVP